MSKNNSKIFIFLFVLLAIGAIYIVYYLHSIGLTASPLAVTVPITSGCQPISNEELLNKNTFQCDAEECIVQGKMSLTQNMGGIDTGGGLRYCIQPGTAGGCSNTNVVKAKCTSCAMGCSGRTLDCGPVNSPPLYSGTFNFCPSSNPNFAQCTGSSNSISTTTSSVIQFTNEVKLLKTQTIEFYPKNSDGTSVSSFSILVKRYDCSCNKAILDGTSCNIGTKYCTPKLTCPTGYILNPGPLRCDYTSNKYSNWCTKGNANSQNIYTCATPITDYSYYKDCSGTQIIGESICNAYESDKKCATLGHQCILDSTKQVGTGVGSCGCLNGVCTQGTKEAIDEDTYRECMPIGSCNGWTTIDCPEGLVFDSITKKCICDPNKECIAGKDMCVDNKKISKCELVTIGSTKCNYYSEPTECEGETICNNKGTDIADDVCDCSTVDECSINQIKCSGTTKYYSCIKDKNDLAFSCMKFRSLNSIDYASGDYRQCVNNVLIPRTDVGCQYNTPGMLCDSLSKQKCVNNECVCIQDSMSAPITDLSKTICINNSIYSIRKYTGENNLACGRYELLSLCNIDEKCVENNNIASCIPKVSGISILNSDKYPIGEPINNVTVKISASIPVGGQSFRTCLRDEQGGTCISGTLKDEYITSTGIKTISYPNYEPLSVQTLYVWIRFESEGQVYEREKEINVAKTLLISLGCPVSAYTNKQIECTLEIKDAATNNLVSNVNREIIITQGTNNINWQYGNTPKYILFDSPNVGKVVVKVNVNAPDYIGVVDSTPITISRPDLSYNIFIDGVALEDKISSGGIQKGIRQIKIELVDSVGDIIFIDGITDVDIKTPSSAHDSIIFDCDETCTGVYDFKEGSGKVYDLGFTALINDPNYVQQSISVSENIPVLSSSSGSGATCDPSKETCVEVCDGYNIFGICLNLNTIIIIIIVLILFITMLIIIFKKGKRR